MNSTISVRAVANRIARTAPRGAMIPSDRYVDVEATPYVMRLLNVHGDIELNPAPPVAEQEVAPAKAAPAATSKKEV